MIKRFDQYTSEDNSSDYLLYYAFDWDDNILNMPTKIHMEHLVDGEWIPTKVSTAEFAEVRNDKDSWRINYDVAFIEFRDQGERGDLAFLEDAKTAISQGKFGPAWDDFIECLSAGSLFAIITARGHESDAMRKGIEWIIDNVLTEDQIYSMYNNLMKYAYHFGEDRGESNDRLLKGQPSKNKLISEYLDSCDFVGVSSPSRGGSPDNPEKAKEEALLSFQTKVNDYAQKIEKKAKIGFSDDDLKNVKHIEDLYANLHKEQFPNIIQFSVKGTKDPKNITKTIRTMESKVNETSEQPTGMESSVLKFTEFGNMAAQLNPQGPDQRQDDFANQFKRQTKYLTKTSKEILGKNKKPKKEIKL
jgi:hypothetical protein